MNKLIKYGEYHGRMSYYLSFSDKDVSMFLNFKGYDYFLQIVDNGNISGNSLNENIEYDKVIFKCIYDRGFLNPRKGRPIELGKSDKTFNAICVVTPEKITILPDYGKIKYDLIIDMKDTTLLYINNNETIKLKSAFQEF